MSYSYSNDSDDSNYVDDNIDDIVEIESGDYVSITDTKTKDTEVFTINQVNKDNSFTIVSQDNREWTVVSDFKNGWLVKDVPIFYSFNLCFF